MCRTGRFLGIISVFILFVSGFTFGFNDGDGTAENPYQISTPQHLISIGSNPDLLDKHYIMVADVNMADYEFTTAVIAPSGYFSGVFDGDGYKVTNLTINGDNYLGLFGKIDKGGKVFRVGIESFNITGSHYLGGLCGKNLKGSITNCYASGSIIGTWDIGGLCGWNFGTVIKSYSAGIVTGGSQIGGLIGNNSSYIGINEGIIANCYSTAEIIAGDKDERIGGLCGGNSSIITNCYATGSVTSGANSKSLGGLCGKNWGGTISFCKAGGNVTAGENSFRIGGLCGYNYVGVITNCYSSGMVSGRSEIAGLCGAVWGSVENCYSTGIVTGEYPGGLIGNCYGNSCNLNIINCFWDIETSGMTISDGGTGKTTTQMQTLSTFTDAGWDFSSDDGDPADWVYTENSYPLFAWQTDLYSEVPDVTGFAEAHGRDIIQSSGFNIGNVEGIYSHSVTLGHVFSQSPFGYWIASNGAEVDLVISLGVPFEGTGQANDPYQISDANDFLNINSNEDFLDRHFILTSDIDMSGHIFDRAVIAPDLDNTNDERNFDGPRFSGTFDGNGHIIKNIVIDLGLNNDPNVYFAGLFGGIGEEGVVKNLGVFNINIKPPALTLILPGGLAGNNQGKITNSFSKGSIAAGYGGWIAGFVGYNSGEINNCYSLCSITTTKRSGVSGLVGDNDGEVINCYWSGVLKAGSDSHVSGLIGNNDGTVINCYSAGVLKAGGDSGISGLIYSGSSSGICTNCFYDSEVSGYYRFRDFAKTTAEMQTHSTFVDAGWDFEGVWWINEGRDYPRLKWQPFGDVNNDSRVDAVDLGLMGASWMSSEGDAGFNGVCELSGDSIIDVADLAEMIDMWLEGPRFHE